MLHALMRNGYGFVYESVLFKIGGDVGEEFKNSLVNNLLNWEGFRNYALFGFIFVIASLNHFC
jgi:hypothetical protein